MGEGLDFIGFFNALEKMLRSLLWYKVFAIFGDLIDI